MPKRVEVNKTLRGRMNFKGRLLQKQTNSATKLQKDDANLRPEKNNPEIVQKSALGGSWASFGKGLGRSWASFRNSCAIFGCFLAVQNRACVKLGPQMVSKRPSGWIFGRFG